LGKIVSVGIFFFCAGSFVLAGVTIALTHVLSGLLQIGHNYDFMYGADKTAFTAECHIVVYNFAYNSGKLADRCRLSNRKQLASK